MIQNKCYIELVESLGDIIALEPITRVLKKENPEIEITWIVKKQYQDVLIANPYIDNILTVSCLKEADDIIHEKIIEGCRIVDLHFDGRICDKTGHVHVNKHNSKMTPEQIFNKHSLLSAFSEIASIPIDNMAPRFYLKQDCDLNKYNLPSHYIVFHLKSAIDYKDWNIDKYNQFAELVMQKGFNIVEIGLDPVINSKNKNYYNLTYIHDIQKLANIVKNADYFFGIDSAFSHMANCFSIYSLILLGDFCSNQYYNPYSGLYKDYINCTIIQSPYGVKEIPVNYVFKIFTKILLGKKSAINKLFKFISIKKLLKYNIFSINKVDIRRVITILGIKFKFKSQNLISRKKILTLEKQCNILNCAYNNVINKYNILNNEYKQYKQTQIIDKQEADKFRGKVYKYPINMESDEPKVYTINWIKENAKVLDVGCSCGELGEKLKELKNSEIIGLEYNSQSIEIAKETNCYKDIIQCDLNKYKNISLKDEKFDYIVCGDVLEHIYEPQNVVEYFKKYLKDDGYFLLSIPNVAHASIKANLLLDNFDYTPTGLLDQTHIRFFTHKTIINFLTDLNLEIEDCKLTHEWGINGSQPNNPYPDLPQEIREFILKDKHSSIVQYVLKCKKNEQQNLSGINSEKIESELNKTPYMPGVEEYLPEE